MNPLIKYIYRLTFIYILYTKIYIYLCKRSEGILNRHTYCPDLLPPEFLISNGLEIIINFKFGTS